MTKPQLTLKDVNDAIAPVKCPHEHKVQKHFQQLKPKVVEATCRCLTCGLDWQEYYRFDYSDE